MLTAGTAAPTAASGYVLHVVPANGGGVDRYVRDICSLRPGDCILHVVPEQCVFEAVTEQRFIAVDHERMADVEVIAALGQAALLHAHSTLAPVRERVAALSGALGLAYVLTLHDIDFAGALAVVSDDERKARLDFVRNAVQRIVPSAFISGLLAQCCGSDISWQLIENGVDAASANDESAPAPDAAGQFQIAVVGALGPHKGLNFLFAVVQALPPEMRVVVVGYADGQLTPGWLQADRLWVHGVFEPRDLPDLLRRYRARIVLFPNRQSESYSYALSDVWCAGLAALGPASGAIGERIAQTGAGWTYDEDASAESVAARIVSCLSGTELAVPCVYRAAAALLSTRDMVERLNQLYEKAMRTPHTRHSEADITTPLQLLETVAATHLNGHFFRGELSKLSGDLAFSKAQTANADQALQAVTHEYDARGAWISTLEKNLAECKAEIARIESARLAEHEQAAAARLDAGVLAEAARAEDRRLAEADRKLSEVTHDRELVQQRLHAEAARVQAHAAHEQYAAKLQQDVDDTLAVAHRQQHTIATYERALSMIPPWIRRQLLARAERLTARKATQ